MCFYLKTQAKDRGYIEKVTLEGGDKPLVVLDWDSLIRQKLYAAAVGGDWQAAKLFLLFVVGRPSDAVDPDALDRDEWKQSQEWPHPADVFAAFGKVVFGDALRTLQNLEPRIVPMFSEAANPDA